MYKLFIISTFYMRTTKTKMAIIYDFDGTLAPGNMQEYNFFPDIDYSGQSRPVIPG